MIDVQHASDLKCVFKRVATAAAELYRLCRYTQLDQQILDKVRLSIAARIVPLVVV